MFKSNFLFQIDLMYCACFISNWYKSEIIRKTLRTIMKRDEDLSRKLFNGLLAMSVPTVIPVNNATYKQLF